jgi:uncharacterized protein
MKPSKHAHVGAVDLAREVYAQAGAMNVDALARMLADDVVMELPFAPEGWARRFVGKPAVVEFQRDAARSFASFAMTVNRILPAGERTAVVEARSSGTTASGRTYDNSYCTILEFDHAGSITRWTEYYDPIAVLASFGTRDER